MKVILFFICLISAASGAILGVDYGQQFTKAVLLAPGVSFEIVLTDEGKRKDLSGISIRDNGDGLERVYGSATGSLCTRFPQSCIMGLKPLLGKPANSPETKAFLGHNFGLKLNGDESRSNSIRFDLGLTNQSYNFAVEEILAMNLHELKGRALSDLEENPSAKPIVEDVAISVPPFATHEMKQAYLDGLKIGNFSNALGLVDEGTAVALNFVSSQKFDKNDLSDDKQYHVIYDMGAGSTTATLFSFTPFSNGSIVLELESIGYDESFGGQLFTNSIYTIILEKFLASFNLKDSTKLPAKPLARIMEAAEKAKIVLSINSDYHVSLENIYDDKDFKTTVTKDEFEEINSDLMDHITKPITDALKNAQPQQSIKDIKSVVLNGGSIRIPFVQKHLATLLGKDRIAKTVNADESCALGTTLRALQLKTEFGTGKDIKVVEKSYHNYEIIIDDGEFDQMVFPRGTHADNSSRISLGELNNEINIGLYEDGRLFKTYKVNDILKKSDQLGCYSKDEKEFFGTFTLDHNKMFDLSKLEVECSKTDKGGFLQKLLKKDSDDSKDADEGEDDEEIEEGESQDSENSTNSTSSKKSKSTRRKSKPISVTIPKPTYPHTKPMSRTTKERTFNKLAYLNSKDELRIEVDHARNILEGQCYELRSYIDDNQDELSKEISEDDISEYSSFVRDTIEWLEFESDGASVNEIREKISELNSKKNTLDSLLEMSKTDISQSGMKKLHEDGTTIAMQVQSYLLEAGTQISEIRQKYEKENFNFDKENDRLKLQLLRDGGDKMMHLDQNLAAFKEDLTRVGELIALNEKKYSKIAKRELYEAYKSATDKIIEMLADIVLIQEQGKNRIDSFNKKFDKLLERKNKKQLRDKLKQEKETEKLVVDNEEEEASGIIEEDSDSEPTVSEGSSETSPEVDHDEL